MGLNTLEHDTNIYLSTLNNPYNKKKHQYFQSHAGTCIQFS